MIKKKLYLFDLDGTLLTTDKKLPEGTLKVLEEYRNEGYSIGVSTSRSEENSMKFLDSLTPDVLISSGGAKVSCNNEIISCSCIDPEKVREVISKAREIAGDLNITVDTDDCEYYRNFIPPQDELEKSFGGSIQTDFRFFDKNALKLCLEIPDELKARKVIDSFPELDAIRFTDGFWYKFTSGGINKENAIRLLCDHLKISPDDVMAFGDDLADIGMLKLCGTGIAMGNGRDEVKKVADKVIGSNDENGIEIFMRIERIRRMEEIFDRALEDNASEEELDILKCYMTNGFLGDYEADEKGLIPKDLKRGVLSEDALYDLLAE